ncbi:hypothetical protein [Komagataeibacter sp. FNDCF1]|uniref:hypothetical protein n=1 Tax=Komagataeibacter sp. FNDCF1 TaxID=2878681 RepID=UPI001E5CC1D4|nr:hypothetical protein [Komagataeibacter sp. FNDCF1]MCE2563788.1 hypothetical protein [Komagataeibacter sp. FNDCF1]MCE2566154.1 hypothetical protein [Komagataeibacter sp. FNDCF1]
MTTLMPLTNQPQVVEIAPGNAATRPLSITSVAFDGVGNLTVTLSDGTVLEPVPCAQQIAAAFGGVALVVVDANGNLLANGRQVGTVSAP